MPDDALIQFSFAGLPENYCFSTPNRFALDIVANMSGYVPGEYSVIIDSETEPSAEDRGKPWYKLLPGGAPSGKLYKYYLGKWVSPNPVEPESAERRIWTGSEAELWSYDGGDGTDPSSSAPTATTGAMWERDTAFDFRFPLGAGTSPKPTTVSVGETGGSEEVTLTPDQLGGHTHNATLSGGPNLGADGGTAGLDEGDGDRESVTAKYSWTVDIEATGDEPHSNMPPYVAVYFIKRTLRQYYTA